MAEMVFGIFQPRSGKEAKVHPEEDLIFFQPRISFPPPFLSLPFPLFSLPLGVRARKCQDLRWAESFLLFSPQQLEAMGSIGPDRQLSAFWRVPRGSVLYHIIGL